MDNNMVLAALMVLGVLVFLVWFASAIAHDYKDQDEVRKYDAPTLGTQIRSENDHPQKRPHTRNAANG